VVPPALREEHADVLASAAKDAGVRVLVPVQAGAMGAALFRDQFHLNPAGAALFTAKLESDLTAPSR
jgi:hypothetical protein